MLLVGVFVIGLGSVAFAQEVHQELQETVRATVIEIVSQSERDITGTNATTTVQRSVEGVVSRVKTLERRGGAVRYAPFPRAFGASSRKSNLMSISVRIGRLAQVSTGINHRFARACLTAGAHQRRS